MAAPTHDTDQQVEDSSTKGATAIEYALILGLLVLALGTGLNELGKSQNQVQASAAETPAETPAEPDAPAPTTPHSGITRASAHI